MNWYGHNMNYEQTKGNYLTRLEDTWGKYEFDKIQRQVMESNVISRFLAKNRDINHMPNQITIIEQVQMARAFWFTSNHSKILVASITLLDRWNNEINKHKRIATDEQLVDNLERIYQRLDNLRSENRVV